MERPGIQAEFPEDRDVEKAADRPVEVAPKQERRVQQAPWTGPPVGRQVHHVVGAERRAEPVPREVEVPREQQPGEGGPPDPRRVLIALCQTYSVTRAGGLPCAGWPHESRPRRRGVPYFQLCLAD